MLGQVLHTIRSPHDGSNKSVIPTGGLEQSCDKYLRGKPGKRQLKRSPRHAFETGKILYPPKNGADIYLTIDQNIQTIVEEELAKGVLSCQAKGGWAVMLDPFSGEILALAQYPFFNPAQLTTYFNDASLIDNTRPKPITDALEPGSVVKAFTAAAALYANECALKLKEPPLFDPDAKIATSNGHFPGRRQPLKDGNFYRFMNLNIAIQKSANIYLARLAELMVSRFGAEWYGNFFREKLGFGQKTGVELLGESSGVIPRPGKKHPNGALEWSSSTAAGLAIGYNIQITPLQLTRAYAMLANGGILVTPTLIKKIVRKQNDGSEEILLDNSDGEREKLFPRVLSEEIIARLKIALNYTTKPGGSASRADVPGYSEAGKTATCKKIINGQYQDIYRASFIGFTPVQKPSFVLLVTMDEPEYRFIAGVGKNHNGGICAAPVFKAISLRVLEYLGVPPDDPYGYPANDKRYKAENAHWIKENRALQQLIQLWNKQ